MDIRTQQYFDRNARTFDALYHEAQPLQRILNRWLRKAIYERLAITFERSEPLAGRTVLDVGCGTGRYAVEFARRGAARVVGIDYAQGMLELARQHAADNGVADRCEFRDADFRTAAMDEQFDVAIAIGVFDYQDRPVAFLRRMIACSRGTVIVSFPGRSLIRMPLRQLRYWWHDRPVFFYRDREVREIAANAGLSKVEIIPIATSGSGYVLTGTI